MKTLRKQRGVAAVETAIALTLVGTIMLPVVVYLGRLTWHDIVLHKAVYEATRILSALPEEVVYSSDAPLVLPQIATDHIMQAAAAAGIDIRPLPGITRVSCNDAGCGTFLPQTVTVDTSIQFTDSVFDSSAAEAIGLGAQLPLFFRYTLNYAP